MSQSPAPRALFPLLSAQRRFVYLTVALLSAAGIWGAFALPSAIYPELQFARITIVAQGTSLGARQQLFSVTRPIEEAVSIVPGVVRVQSRTIRGASEINILFSPSTEMVDALQQVRARVTQVEAELPGGMEIVTERQVPSLFPILSYNVEGGDPATLYDIARYQIKPVFSRAPGVGRVDVLGNDQREIEVVADPGKLAAQGMTYEDLATAIEQGTSVAAVGRMPANYKQYLIVSATEAHSVDDIANVVIGRGLRVRDVATVTPGTEDHVRIIAGDGKPVAQINVTRQVGGNALAVADSIAAMAADLGPALPPGVRLKLVYDQAELVKDAVHSVRDAMLIGAALAVIVLLLFLRHARITAISASAIPLTMSITIFVMWALGQTFNLMTLGAMAIAIGLVIDDAVVITENIVRHLHLTGDRTAAIRNAVQELIWPVTTSTLTTVVVFLPLGLLEGVVGQFFRALSITLTIAVLVSLVLALSIIPLLSAQWLTARDAEHTSAGDVAPAGILAPLARGMEALARGYERSSARPCITPRPWPSWRCSWSGAGGWRTVRWRRASCRRWTRAPSSSTTSRRAAPRWRKPTGTCVAWTRSSRKHPRSSVPRGAPARSWACSPPDRTPAISSSGCGGSPTASAPSWRSWMTSAHASRRASRACASSSCRSCRT